MTGLAAGARIADYQLQERIGQGGMAIVYRALEEPLNRQVALKVLAPSLASGEEFRQRFLSESRAAATIDDPHIVPVFAAGEADGVLFIAMRYVAGGDAQSLLRREGPLAPERVAAIISPVASALDAAHRAGLVHRDVKPSNMLVDLLPGRPAHVYLSDFGVSKSMAATSALTAAGAVLGTLTYASPEQVRSQPVDGRSDQYALACSAYELLVGVPPFQRTDPAALMYAHLFEDPPLLTSRRPDIAAAADDVLARALAKEPGDRHASCGEFADALRGALGLAPYRLGLPTPPAGTRPPANGSGHPPTAPARPDDREDARDGVPPAAEGAGPAPASTRPDTVPAAGQRHADGGPVADGDGTARRKRRRRLSRRGVAAACVAAAGLAAGFLFAPRSPAAPVATVPVAVKSALAPLSGDVYVVYGGGKLANAQVSGEVSEAANGEVARLYAQRFPYQNAPVAVGSVTLHPVDGAARYVFQVTPTLATRYRVELFLRSAPSTPVAMSVIKTVYATIGEGTNDAQECDGSVCYVTLAADFSAPPSVLKFEMSKKPYLYAGINLSKPHTKAPPPKWLSLGTGAGTVLLTEQTSANQFSLTASFSFTVGNDSDKVGVAVCVQDSLAADGLGLPGRHGCGDQRLPDPSGYVG